MGIKNEGLVKGRGLHGRMNSGSDENLVAFYPRTGKLRRDALMKKRMEIDGYARTSMLTGDTGTGTHASMHTCTHTDLNVCGP
eukprot:1157891-Pelagomonas_calceolata.AAC.1